MIARLLLLPLPLSHPGRRSRPNNKSVSGALSFKCGALLNDVSGDRYGFSFKLGFHLTESPDPKCSPVFRRVHTGLPRLVAGLTVEKPGEVVDVAKKNEA